MSTRRLTWYLLATALAVCVYLYGLGSPHIPKNGDELVYAHITRLTAASGHWLPLQSELDHMRNTKPPLLFWQGIAATHGGTDWSLWQLRYPSVIYTLLTALLVFLLARRLAQQRGGPGEVTPTETGFIAALTFLAFFSTYRFGRPFLVNPPEVFWFFLPFFTLLYWQAVAFESRWRLPVLLGIQIGIGLLYKSFALIAPVSLALAWWYLHRRDYRVRRFLAEDAGKIVLTLAVALALFSLWFVLDPNPRAIWQEFVVGENAGKFGARGQGYLANLLWGGSSVWALLVGYPMNAGLLAFPVAAVFFVAWLQRGRLSDAETMLWIWMFALFIVFCAPSQRSARYLLDAMPGLAVICALHWPRIHRGFFVASLLFAAAVSGLLTFLAVRLQHEVSGLYPAGFWWLLAATAALLLFGLLSARHVRAVVNVVVLLVMLSLAAFLSPFDGARGSFSAAAQQQVQGRDVWVPCNFRAVDEGYRFLLPGAKVHGYAALPSRGVAELSSNYALFAVQLPLDADCPGCRVLGQRLELRSRHSPDEIKRMLRGEVFQLLFVKELLLAAPQAAPDQPLREECR
jgi:4-amino-4-deoxy-L-arabinose transferase-like glycosyltransferase